MGTTTEGEPPSNVAGRLEAELQALLRQRSQYRVALETATDSRIVAKMVKDLNRLDAEITACEDALSALPDHRSEPPPLMSLRSLGPGGPTNRLNFETSMKEFEDDEPATTLYDGTSRMGLLPSAPPPKRDASGPIGSVRVSVIEQSGARVNGTAPSVREGDTVASRSDAASQSAKSQGETSGSRGETSKEDASRDRTSADVPGETSSRGEAMGFMATPVAATEGAMGETGTSSIEADIASTGGQASELPVSPSSAAPMMVELTGSGPVSIHELEALEAHTEWNSELSPASFASPEDVSSVRPTPKRFRRALPRMWLAIGLGATVVVGGLVWAIAVWVMS